MNNFEKIKSLTLDEMVEFFTQEYDSDFTDGYCQPTICYDCKLSTTCDKFKENVKQWLLQESVEGDSEGGKIKRSECPYGGIDCAWCAEECE